MLILEKSLKTYYGTSINQYCIFASFFLSVSNYFVSGSADNSVCVYDINSKELVQKLAGHKDVVVAVSSHPTRGIIASGALENDMKVKIWSNQDKE